MKSRPLALAGNTLIAPHPFDAPPGASQRLRSVTLSFGTRRAPCAAMLESALP